MSSHSVATHTACKAAITQILTQMFAKLEQVGGGEGAGGERGEREDEREDEEEGEDEEDEEVSAMMLAKSLVGSVFQSLGLHVDSRRTREGEDSEEREEREERELREEMKERMKEKREKESKREKEKREAKKLAEDVSSPFHVTPMSNGREDERDSKEEKGKQWSQSSEGEEERHSKEERAGSLSGEEKTDKAKGPATPVNGASHKATVSVTRLPDISPELTVPPNADAVLHDDPNVVFHDCFLVFRALCKLSIKDVRPCCFLSTLSILIFSFFLSFFSSGERHEEANSCVFRVAHGSPSGFAGYAE